MSRASGADAYVHSDGTGARSCFRSSSVNGEVVRALVRARLLLPELHQQDRKSTRLNSSHVKNSYALFCLKKKYTQPREPLRLHCYDQWRAVASTRRGG